MSIVSLESADEKKVSASILNFLTAYGVISLLSKCVDSWFSNPKQLLDRRGILTVTGQSKWNQATINSFLRNEVRQDDTNLENIHTRLPHEEGGEEHRASPQLLRGAEPSCHHRPGNF